MQRFKSSSAKKQGLMMPIEAPRNAGQRSQWIGSQDYHCPTDMTLY